MRAIPDGRTEPAGRRRQRLELSTLVRYPVQPDGYDHLYSSKGESREDHG